jgi:hypothetical protein
MFIRAMVRTFSFGERWNVPLNSAVASLNGTFHLSSHENILTIALINIHYLYKVLILCGLVSNIIMQFNEIYLLPQGIKRQMCKIDHQAFPYCISLE